MFGTFSSDSFNMEHYPKTFVNTFRRYVHFFSFIGIKIFGDENNGVGFKFWVIAPYFVLMFASLLTMAIKSVKDRESIVEISHSISATFVVWQGVVKLVVLVRQRSNIRCILHGLARSWAHSEPTGPDNEKSALINFYLKRLKIYDNGYFTFSVLGVMSYVVSPVALAMYHWRDPNPSFILSLNTYFPFTVDTYPKFFIAHIIQAFFEMSFYMTVSMSMDMMLAAMTSAACLQLHLLQVDLRRAVAAHAHAGGNDLGRAVGGIDLKAVVREHQVLLELAKQIDSTFSVVTFACTFSASVLISFFLFLTTITSGVDRLKVFMGCGAMVINVFNFSWLGQLIYDTSTGTADAAYDSAWFDADEKTKRLIMIVIMRSQKPCHLSAAGFSKMTLISASTALSSAFSYFSLMRQLFRDLSLENALKDST